MGIIIMKGIIVFILLFTFAVAFLTKSPGKEKEEPSKYDDVDDYILLYRLYRSGCICKRIRELGDICIELECCDRYEYVPKNIREKVCKRGICKFFDIEEMAIVE